MEKLWELFRDLGNSLDLEANLSVLDDGLRRAVDYDAISVHLSEDGRLSCAYAAGVGFRQLASRECPLGRGLPGTVASTRRPAINRPVEEPVGLALALAVPLEHVRRFAGVLSVYRAQVRRFTEEDLRTLIAVAPKLAACIGNAARFQHVEAANSRALFERLDAEVARVGRSRGRLAVLECVLHGLGTGEPAAERVAGELRRACREYDFVARSGDSLVVVLADFAPTALEETRARIEKVLREAGLTPKIGAALFPADGADADDLLATAHGAAYA